jgi:hypothetical protein
MLKTTLRPALFWGMLLGSAGQALAADYYIRDRDPDGLVGAIRHANTRAGADTIHLAQGGLYTFKRPADAGLALPPVTGQLRILGNGAELRRDSDEGMAILVVAAKAELDIDALTLAEGSSGSVRNHGTLRLTRSAVVDGTTRAESAIVQNYGRFEASDSVFGYNVVTGAGRDASIVLNYGEMQLERCRLAGNALSRRYPSLAAAPVLNYGELRLDALALEDNTVLDEFEGMVSASVLNLGIGRTASAQLPPRP